MKSSIFSLQFLLIIIQLSKQNDIQTNYNKQPIFKQGFCANQQMLQSPINILPPFTFMKFSAKFNFYEVPSGEIINNGNYLTLFGDFGNFEYQNSVFNIYEIQFKSPSEHSVGATEQEFPLEIQFISTNKEKMYINIAVLFSLEENSDDNAFLKAIGFGNGILAHLKRNSSFEFNSPISLGNILPYKDQFFIYQGTQTTPNCQPTIWFITYDSQILNSDQLKDFPQNLIFHQRKRSQQARPIFITFYEEEALAQYEQQQQEEKIPQKSSNESQQQQQQDDKKDKNEIKFKESNEKLEDAQNQVVSQQKLDLLGIDDDLYEKDFYSGNQQTNGKELSQDNTLLVVTKNEYINQNNDNPQRVILSDESLDQIINDLDNQAQQNSPFLETNSNENNDNDINEQNNENNNNTNPNEDIITEKVIESAVNQQARNQLKNSFELDNENNDIPEEIQDYEQENPIVYEFQKPEIKQIKQQSYQVKKKNIRSNDDILSLDAKNEDFENQNNQNYDNDYQEMSFLQMNNKFLRKKNKNNQQTQQQQQQQNNANNMCLIGKEQSPINIYPDEQFYCEPCSLKVNFLQEIYEKSIKIKNDPIKQALKIYGANFGEIIYGEHSFQVQEILIKSPSEHTFGKKSDKMDMEIQILCVDKYGLKVIISTFYQSLGDEYDELDEFLEQLHIYEDFTQSSYIAENQEIIISTQGLSLNMLFDEIINFISYDGSLAYLPCTEGVKWFLLRERKSITQNQIQSFLKMHGGPTQNRNTQGLGFRKIYIF